MAPTLTWGVLSVSTYRLLRVTAVLVFVAALVLRLRRGRWPVTGRDILLAVPFLELGLLVGASVEVALPPLADHLLRGMPLLPGWWAGYLVCRVRRLPVGRCFDLFAVPLPLALAVARVGCLLRGCCYGRQATAWPAMRLPDIHGHWASRYPTQLADILANLLIFALLAMLERRAGRSAPHPDRARGEGESRPFDGFLFLLFVMLHYGQRFVFEFWRADAPPLAGPFSWTHLYCVVAVGLSAWGLARGLRRTG